MTNSLETEVRTALIGHIANELYNDLITEPQFREEICDDSDFSEKNLMEIAHMFAKKQFLTYEEAEQSLKTRLEHIEPSLGTTAGKDFLKQYEKAHKGMLDYHKTIDNYVQRLAGIAESKGILQAMQERYNVLQQLLPTIKKYNAGVIEWIPKLREFYEQQIEELSKNTDILTRGGFFSTLAVSLFKNKVGYLKKLEKVNKKLLMHAAVFVYANI